MGKRVEIEKARNGYIVVEQRGFGVDKEVFETLEEAFQHLLQVFEGRAEGFGGSSYGKVVIQGELEGKAVKR
jgi:hypothetical protein